MIITLPAEPGYGNAAFVTVLDRSNNCDEVYSLVYLFVLFIDPLTPCFSRPCWCSCIACCCFWLVKSSGGLAIAFSPFFLLLSCFDWIDRFFFFF